MLQRLTLLPALAACLLAGCNYTEPSNNGDQGLLNIGNPYVPADDSWVPVVPLDGDTVIEVTRDDEMGQACGDLAPSDPSECQVSQEHPSRVDARCVDPSVCEVVDTGAGTVTVRGKSIGTTKLEATATFDDEEVTDTRTIEIIGVDTIVVLCQLDPTGRCEPRDEIGDALELSVGESLSISAHPKGTRASGEEIFLDDWFAVETHASPGLDLELQADRTLVLTATEPGTWELILSAAEEERAIQVSGQ